MRIDDTGGGAPWQALAGGSLLPPTTTEPMPDLAEQVLGFQDWVSITHGINWAIEKVCGVDVFDFLSTAYTGSWEDFSKAGSAVEHLSAWVNTTSGQVAGLTFQLSLGWAGNAADAAFDYFGRLQEGLGTLRDALTGLASDYQTTATGVYFAGQMTVSLLQELCDWLIAIALDALATASTGWTGIGAVIGAAAGAYLVWEASQVWLTILEWHGRAVAAAEGFAGLCAANLALVKGLEGVRLPASTYDSART